MCNQVPETPVLGGGGHRYRCSGGQCAQISGVEVVSVPVGEDAVAVFVKAGGAAAACVEALGGTLSLAQLRVLYTSLNGTALTSSGFAYAAAVPNDDGDGVLEWSDLHAACDPVPVHASGGGLLSGAAAMMHDALFREPGETFGRAAAAHAACTIPNGNAAEAVDAAQCAYWASSDNEVLFRFVESHPGAVGFGSYSRFATGAVAGHSPAGLALVPVSPSDDVPAGHDSAIPGVVASAQAVASREYPSALTAAITARFIDEAAVWRLTEQAGHLAVCHGVSPHPTHGPHGEVPGLLPLPSIAQEATCSWYGDESEAQAITQVNSTEPFAFVTIAGCNSMFTLAQQVAEIYTQALSSEGLTHNDVHVAGGGTDWAVAALCSRFSVVGMMSRDWDVDAGEASLTGADGYTYTCGEASQVFNDMTQCAPGNSSLCANRPVEAAQFLVGHDALRVASRTDGSASQCAEALGGFSFAQLRWMFTSWSDAKLEEDGVVLAEVAPNSDGDNVREWSDLSPACAEEPVLIGGAKAHTSEYRFFASKVLGDTFEGAANASCVSASGGDPDLCPENVAGFAEMHFGECPYDLDNPCPYLNYADDADLILIATHLPNAVVFFNSRVYQTAGGRISAYSILDAAAGSGDYVTPDEDASERYPLSRSLYMNVNTEFLAVVAPFMEVLYSPLASTMLRGAGYVPLSTAENEDMLLRLEKVVGTAAADGGACSDSDADPSPALHELTLPAGIAGLVVALFLYAALHVPQAVVGTGAKVGIFEESYGPGGPGRQPSLKGSEFTDMERMDSASEGVLQTQGSGHFGVHVAVDKDGRPRRSSFGSVDLDSQQLPRRRLSLKYKTFTASPAANNITLASKLDRSTDEGELDSSMIELIGDRPFAVGGASRLHLASYNERLIACKIFDLSGLSDLKKLTLVRSFNREYTLMGQVSHKNLLNVYGVTTTVPDKLVMSLEFMQHGSMRRVLNMRGYQLTWAWRHQAMIQIAKGCAHLHANNIEHRDLKSPNVLVDADMQCKVADFGISRCTATVPTWHSQTGFKGTVAWSPPEILMNQRHTRESDQYAYGVLLWEMLTRLIPWAGVPLPTIAMAVCMGERPKFPATTPPPYVAMVSQCWDPDPSARLTFDECIDLLERMTPPEGAPVDVYDGTDYDEDESYGPDGIGNEDGANMTSLNTGGFGVSVQGLPESDVYRRTVAAAAEGPDSDDEFVPPTAEELAEGGDLRPQAKPMETMPYIIDEDKLQQWLVARCLDRSNLGLAAQLGAFPEEGDRLMTIGGLNGYGPNGEFRGRLPSVADAGHTVASAPQTTSIGESTGTPGTGARFFGAGGGAFVARSTSAASTHNTQQSR